ncbi:4-hydroxy-tetrahydrodipicolinate reductase [Aquihabitans sp. G128]|uniref:4-hydroxy-tetrahydrodipicolinate reductase n=1 Tax=Aquihabitans sp. G128 TaxID=2849779 RepID=UPI001C23ED27|nr:4-hydroxy-tetrahydrodipicolinate reductase [Aquihabitans sp. G128]QXC62439.1 4-hydroxy-tetrahydrodipicolinate reductase [Aquihabitans sp. G128]
MAITVGVFGAAGKMGATVCRAVAEDPELELVAAVDPGAAGEPLRTVAGLDIDLEVAGKAEHLGERPQVMVDFTHLEAARRNLAWCAAEGVHAVVGTTGFTDEDRERFRATFNASNCLIAPNFAIGAILMMRFAELAAPWFETAEVLEFHHDAKVDSPSGTAMRTVERMAAASSDWAPDPTTTDTVAGARGGEGAPGIHVHAIRMRGMVAHQEVLLGTTGQTLSIRHDSYDRSSFMPGVVLAAKRVADHPGLTIGLDALLDL